MLQGRTWGEWLKLLRHQRELTQEALAEMVGCAAPTIRSFEQGRRRPSLFLAERLAMILDLPPEQHAAFVDNARQPPRDESTSAATLIDKAPLLPRTKLRPPRVRADVIARPRLLDGLRRTVVTYPLTLVSAPAGAGKTTLLASLPHLHPDAPLGWLALDANDDDPRIFLAGLVAALGQIDPRYGAVVQTLLASDMDPRTELRRLMTALINDLADDLDDPTLLVLDDLHVITSPAIYDALDFLVERLPPALHLIIGTRTDPPISLPRLRARRNVAEWRLADLRFTLDETEQLLNTALTLDLSAAHIHELHQRTEGWAAGMSLLVSSLERMVPTERAVFIQRLHHTERAIFEYLADEVLQQQEPFVRMFLLETSILPELTPAACAAVTGHTNSAAVLDDLYRRNLFLVALDGTQSAATYRYHDLFAAFLRDRLKREHPSWLADLHRRAAQVETQPQRRIQHYLHAEAWNEAATAIEQVGQSMLDTGMEAVLQPWLAALPMQLRTERPLLIYFQAFCAMHSWNLREARPLLEQACQRFAALDDTRRYGEAMLYLADTYRMLGEYAAASEISATTMQLDLPPRERTRLLLSLAWQALNDGDGPQVLKYLDDMLTLLQTGEHHAALYTLAVSYQSPLVLIEGGVARAERFCQILARYTDQPGPLQALETALRGMCALLRGRIDDAERLGVQALAMSQQLGGLVWLDLGYGMIAAVAIGLNGNIPAARKRIEILIEQLQHPSNHAVQGWQATYILWLGRFAWLDGDTTYLRAVQQRMQAAQSPHEWPIAPNMRALLAALVALSHNDDQQAEAILTQLHQPTHTSEVRFGGDPTVSLAAIYWRTNRAAAAWRVFEPLLATYAHEDVPGFLLFEDPTMVIPLLQLALAHNTHTAFAQRVLSLLGEPAISVQPERSAVSLASGEMLTPRELEVLRLLVNGASNQVIADTLVISLHTVKRHVTNILQKLGVTSRLEAVGCARELGLF